MTNPDYVSKESFDMALQTIEINTPIKYKELMIDSKPGFKIGHGSISYEKQINSGELTESAAIDARNHILSEEAYSQIDKIDDTCVDGRISVLTMKKLEDGTIFETDISYIRAKVPGGGQQMIGVGMIGLGIIEDNALSQAKTAISFMQSHGIKYGSHTDTKACEDNCGCGAIDKFPQISESALKYRNEITNIITQIYTQILDSEPDFKLINNVFTGYEEIVTSPTFFNHYSGKQVSEAVQDSGAVVKKLGDNHKEDFIVLNFVPGTTLNQRKLVQYTENTVQSFCVDVWRMQELANFVGGNNEELSTQAFYSMLIYGLATFATLTDGTLPVIARY